MEMVDLWMFHQLFAKGDDLPNGMWSTFGLHLCQLRIGGLISQHIGGAKGWDVYTPED